LLKLFHKLVNVEDQHSPIVHHENHVRVGPLIRDMEEEHGRALFLGVVSLVITILNWKTNSTSNSAMAVNTATLEKAPDQPKGFHSMCRVM
jgi:hypothetical protein